MSEARELYYIEINKPWHKTRRAQIENYVSELEQQKAELINLLCERCDYIGACEVEEILCAVNKYK